MVWSKIIFIPHYLRIGIKSDERGSSTLLELYGKTFHCAELLHLVNLAHEVGNEPGAILWC